VRVLYHNSVGSILWQSEKNNEMHKVKVESGGILTYMHKVGKMTFYQKTFKNDPTLKYFPNTQSNTYLNIPQETQEPYQTIFKLEKTTMKLILLLIGLITGSAALHQASRAHIHCAVQCLNAHIFY
jgi:hypothetical protein